MGRYDSGRYLISLVGVQKGFRVRQLNNSISVSLDDSVTAGHCCEKCLKVTVGERKELKYHVRRKKKSNQYHLSESR